MSTRTYADAIEKLNSVQSNAAYLDVMRGSGDRLNGLIMPEVVEYLVRIGHTPEELNKLNVIHVTGTKGKGSTCAFCDSILRQALPGKQIGLYTSPHMVTVRERIRVNGSPISENDFSKFFFDVWDLLERNDRRADPRTPLKPMYFRLIMLVAFHAFLSIKVDVTILEVGVGGLYDCTNIVPRPIVTGVSSLGIDHVGVLGSTLKEIAFNKGGIFKEGVPALSVEQPEEGMVMLRQCALERKASNFTVVPNYPELSALKLGLAGAHQRLNASLAIHLAHTLLQKKYPNQSAASPIPLNDDVVKGLQLAHWPGRCHEIRDPKAAGTTWFLDGAHTVESLTCGMEWFASVSFHSDDHFHGKNKYRVLVFNCTNGRSGRKFLETIIDTIRLQLQRQNIEIDANSVRIRIFDKVIFCTNVTYVNGVCKPELAFAGQSADLTTQSDLATAWTSLVPEFHASNVHVLPSIEHAVQVVRSLEDHQSSVDILVCGSLHLVGGLIEVTGLAEIALRT